MKSTLLRFLLVACLPLLKVCPSSAAEPPKTIALWPDIAPGEKGDLGEEKDTSKPGEGLVAGKPLIRLGNVSKPTITIYRPPADKDTGTAVVVCPGGGYNILALDLEGTEVCEWLNSIGVTGVLLKYRVPKRANLERQTPPLQDAQRAFGITRQHAKEWGIDPQRVGVLGFSAGAHLSAVLCASNSARAYPPVDDADKLNCRPDFTLLIYPAYLTTDNKGETIAKEVAVTTNTPPMFIAMSQDDPVHVENALLYALAMKQAKVPVELHIYPTGGHGYGLRRTKNFVTTWPDRAAEWMKSSGLLGK